MVSTDGSHWLRRTGPHELVYCTSGCVKNIAEIGCKTVYAPRTLKYCNKNADVFGKNTITH